MKIYKNLWGMGIGFPEKIRDREGEVGLAVGLKKFAKTANEMECF